MSHGDIDSLESLGAILVDLKGSETLESLLAKESTSLSFQLLQRCPVHLFVKDSEYRYQFINSFAEEYMKESLKDSDLSDYRQVVDERLVDAEDLEVFRKEDTAILKGSDPARYILEYWHPREGSDLKLRYGTMRYAIVASSEQKHGQVADQCAQDQGERIGVVSIATNIEDILVGQVIETVASILNHDLSGHLATGAIARLRNASSDDPGSKEILEDVSLALKHIRSLLVNASYYMRRSYAVGPRMKPVKGEEDNPPAVQLRFAINVAHRLSYVSLGYEIPDFRIEGDSAELTVKVYESFMVSALFNIHINHFVHGLATDGLEYKINRSAEADGQVTILVRSKSRSDGMNSDPKKKRGLKYVEDIIEQSGGECHLILDDPGYFCIEMTLPV